MNWHIKAALYRVLGAIDRNHSVHRLVQRHLTGRLRPQTHLKDFRGHRDALLLHAGTLDGTLYEFGAGWHLSSQLAMWCYGVPRQITLDIERLSRPALVEETVRAFAALDEPGFVRRPTPGMTLKDLDIDYRAPADARKTGLASRSIDFIISTNTLEHIPPEDILGIMTECRRLCHAGSLLSMAIDYSDHYSHGNDSLPMLHYLRFSDEEWQPFQSRLLWQNRLRHSDYGQLFRQAGFIVLEESSEIVPEDLEALARLPLAERFRDYTLDDLGARYGRYVLRPA